MSLKNKDIKKILQIIKKYNKKKKKRKIKRKIKRITKIINNIQPSSNLQPYSISVEPRGTSNSVNIENDNLKNQLVLYKNKTDDEDKNNLLLNFEKSLRNEIDNEKKIIRSVGDDIYKRLRSVEDKTFFDDNKSEIDEKIDNKKLFKYNGKLYKTEGGVKRAHTIYLKRKTKENTQKYDNTILKNQLSLNLREKIDDEKQLIRNVEDKPLEELTNDLFLELDNEIIKEEKKLSHRKRKQIKQEQEEQIKKEQEEQIKKEQEEQIKINKKQKKKDKKEAQILSDEIKLVSDNDYIKDDKINQIRILTEKYKINIKGNVKKSKYYKTGLEELLDSLK